MRRFKCTVGYKGARYKGSQIQTDLPTIEGELTRAILNVCSDVKKIKSSGRTDTGVHAKEQVFHFDSELNIETNKLTLALNANLPSDIRILRTEYVDSSFDARYSAKSREYKFLFSNENIPDYLLEHIVIIQSPINKEIISKCAKLFIGEKDFIGFRKKGSNEKSTVRKVTYFKIKMLTHHNIYNHNESIKYIEAHIKANGFLYRMVRNIMGAIFEVNRGKYSLSELKNFINKKDNSFKYAAAPAKGLSLTKVNY